jgi:hypothetical protein
MKITTLKDALKYVKNNPNNEVYANRKNYFFLECEEQKKCKCHEQERFSLKLILNMKLNDKPGHFFEGN